MMKPVGIFPGSFDPPTLGHVDAIKRAASICSTLFVVVANSGVKRGNELLSTDERVCLLQAIFCHSPNIRVEGYEGLLADTVVKKQASLILRSVRNPSDVVYELEMAQANRALTSSIKKKDSSFGDSEGIETLLLPPSPECSFISSTLVRDIYKHQGDLTAFVPKEVAVFLESRKFSNKGGDGL